MIKIFIRIIGVLICIMGVTLLVATYYDYTAYQQLISRLGEDLDLGSISNWDIFWSLHEFWILGFASLIAGIGIFWKNSYTWGLFVAVCIVQFISSGRALYNITTNEMVYNLPEADYLPWLIATWIILFIISISGILLSFSPSIKNQLPSTSKKWYFLGTMLTILTIFTFIL